MQGLQMIRERQGHARIEADNEFLGSVALQAFCLCLSPNCGPISVPAAAAQTRHLVLSICFHLHRRPNMFGPLAVAFSYGLFSNRQPPNNFGFSC